MNYKTPPNYPPTQNAQPITIISKHHGWRTLSGIQTSDYFAYRRAIQNGCHLQQVSFILRHPEEMICDLSNLDTIYNGMYHSDIAAIWNYLDSSTWKIKRDGVGRVEGDGLSPEIAIYGPSELILKDMKNSLVNEAFSHHQYDQISSATDNRSWGIAKNRLLINSSVQTIDFHNQFCAYYSKYVSHEHWDNCSAFNTRYIYEDHEIWRQIEKISTNKLFLLSAGLPLALGYIAATGDNHIYFSEIHRQNDASLLNKDVSFDGIFPLPTSPNESWLVIDKAYTGGSLRQAANAIRTKYGYDIEVKTIALFPKSFGAFMGADYAVYAGKLFNVKAYAPRLNRDLWHLQLLVETPT